MTRFTPHQVTELAPDEVFVFGSNASGHHGGGAAHIAWQKFGAVWGEGHGLHGQTYAIDTMSGMGAFRADAETFVSFAQQHPELTFLLTPVGCGIAGYTPEEVAPMFATLPANVVLPEVFARALGVNGPHPPDDATSSDGDPLF